MEFWKSTSDYVTVPGFTHMRSDLIILEYFCQLQRVNISVALPKACLWLPKLPTASRKCWGLIASSSSLQVIVEVIGLHCSPALPWGLNSSHPGASCTLLASFLSHLLTCLPCHHFTFTWGPPECLLSACFWGNLNHDTRRQ